MPALLFDLYGVIMKVQTEAGMAEIQRAAGHPGDDFWDAYWGCRDGYDKGDLSPEDYWALVADALGRPIASVPDAVAADTHGWLEADDEMVAYVGGLIDAGVRCAVLSNIPRAVADAIRPLHPWLADFDPLLLSFEVGRAKPHLDSFEHAVAELGLPADEVLFIDDRQVNIDAAEAAGLRAHLFTDRATLRPAVARHLASA